jgi:NTP pyrophosphatase (non-canonical NTP hydrolase)
MKFMIGVKDLAISISIEAAELLEHFQWRHDGHDLTDLDVEKIAEEASDVLLYTLMLFDRLGLDPEVEAFRKIERNANRFPVEQAFGQPGSILKRKA